MKEITLGTTASKSPAQRLIHPGAFQRSDGVGGHVHYLRDCRLGKDSNHSINLSMSPLLFELELEHSFSAVSSRACGPENRVRCLTFDCPMSNRGNKLLSRDRAVRPLFSWVLERCNFFFAFWLSGRFWLTSCTCHYCQTIIFLS